MTESLVAADAAEIAAAFPQLDPGAAPLGARILIQLRKAKTKTTESGIILVEETKETEKYNNMVGKVIEIGPLAFKKRDTMEPWPEGSWCEVGDFVRVPKWGGDRWDMPDPNTEKEVISFCLINDHEVFAKITCNPLLMKAFV
jgi:co-chaperonin GroES (HSP10)